MAEHQKLDKEYNKGVEQEKALKIRLEAQARRLNDLLGVLYYIENMG